MLCLLGLWSQTSGLNMRNRNGAGNARLWLSRSRARALGSCHETVGACSTHPHILCYSQAQTQRVLLAPGALLTSLSFGEPGFRAQFQTRVSLPQEPEPETCGRDWGLRLSSGSSAALQPVQDHPRDWQKTCLSCLGLPHHHLVAPTFLEAGEKWSPWASDCLQILARLR